MDEFTSVSAALVSYRKIWVGGKYNSTMGSYIWIASGVAVNISEMLKYHDWDRHDRNPCLILKTDRTAPKLRSEKAYADVDATLCEDYS